MATLKRDRDILEEFDSMGRRRFLKDSVASFTLLGVALCLAACESSYSGDDNDSASTPEEDDSPEPSQDPAPAIADKAATIGSNHGHTATLTAEQQQSGQAVTLLLTPGDGHTHTVSLSAADIAAIAGGSSVTRTSSLNEHTHPVTFN